MKLFNKNIIPVALMTLALLVAISACETITPHDTSEARKRAISAANAVIALDTVAKPDTLLLQRALLEANNIRCEYVLADKDYMVEAFDEAFRSQLLKADTALAVIIFPEILYE